MHKFRHWLIAFGLVLLGLPVQAAFDRDYAEGLALLQQQAFEAALPALTRSTQQQPRSDNFFALGVTLFRLHRLPETWQAYQQALKYLPAPDLKARIRSGLGDLYFTTEDYTAALSAYREALDHEPSWNGARLRLATAYLRLERYSEALKETELALSYAGPGTQPELHSLRGVIYLAQQQWPQAMHELQALSHYPGYFIEAQQHLNWMHRLRKNYPAANTIAENLVQQHGQPQTWQVAALTKLEYLHACELQILVCPSELYHQLSQQAGEVLSRWVLSTPHQPQAYYYLGQWAQQRLDWPAARLAYQRAQQLFPQRALYQLKYAEMLWTLGDRERAEALLKQIPFQPDDWAERLKWPMFASLTSDGLQQPELEMSAQALFWQGYLHWQNTHSSKNHAWQTLLNQLESTPEARLTEALQLLQSGEQTWTYALLRQAAQARPENWLPSYYLGILQAEQDCAAALPWLQRAYRQHPTALLLHHQLLRCLPPVEQAAQLQRSLQTFPGEDAFHKLYLERQR